MANIKFPGGEWYPLVTEGTGYPVKSTTVMKVPGGVMMRVNSRGPTGMMAESLAFIPGAGIKADPNRSEKWALCLEIQNEVAE